MSVEENKAMLLVIPEASVVIDCSAQQRADEEQVGSELVKTVHVCTSSLTQKVVHLFLMI